MVDPVQALYEDRDYPAMSHPPSDPAVSAAAARLRGLRACLPSNAAILEIGCGSGLNLLPLAMRWPKSRFVGIDISNRNIGLARNLANEAGVSNICFEVADLRTHEIPSASFDFIIAHGFLSWVPDEVKARLFTSCQQGLRPNGIATVSFNVEAGWKPRWPVIHKARAIQQAGAGDLMNALAILRSVTDSNSPEQPIIGDMLAKGLGILPFDDFAVVNDPWSLHRFVTESMNAGLLWLGESEVAQNFQGTSCQSLDSQEKADCAILRTFRSVVLCREDSEFDEINGFKQLLETSVLANPAVVKTLPGWLQERFDLLGGGCVAVGRLAGDSPSEREVRGMEQLMQSGVLLPRMEPFDFDPDAPPVPTLDALRLACARRRLPLVDVWHKACGFPPPHFQVLEAMDGSRDREELAARARLQCPDLAFEPWLRHLAGRGMFS